jgi:Family of unknown function (DUF5989)
MGSFMIEFWSFLRVRKKFWLAPIMMTIAVVGALLRAIQDVHYRAIPKLRQDARKAERKLDTRRKIIIAGAVIAEARDDPAFEAHIKAIVRKRVTGPLDVTAVTEWLSITSERGGYFARQRSQRSSGD